MATCSLCGFTSPLLPKAVGVCRRCLLERMEEAVEAALKHHAEARVKFNLPPFPPKTRGGVRCTLCAAECIMQDGEVGYCGIRKAENSRIKSLSTPDKALLHYYLDPHVTNCCNAYFCPAGTGCGYPKYAVKPGPETGYYNLALFFYGCSFNCLFCQNWNHKILNQAKLTSADEIVNLTLGNRRITCWCWFGGSAEPQLPFALNASRLVLERKPEGRLVRICWEWNGDGHSALVRRAAELSYESGGNVKFDLKAWNKPIHIALTGMDNERVLRNFELVYRGFYERRRGVPVLGATTLLVPHYVDEEEVGEIARFVASLDDEIPYNLLVFHPDFMMDDIPATPEKQVWSCYKAAKKYLKNVNVSNLHLLGWRSTTLTWGLAGKVVS
ncbi:MAG TPA: radical SAM protein [Candidatus Caldiarchaeum subterraneum]|uniref:Radical SAM protein n=1 Tax=Caldiarchaeum subterraneum TaxID=311458 RepID=A0A832ZX51_CALS0|nr:radical SAM protein [Candidatus Caldarchaeum subterraneum]